MSTWFLRLCLPWRQHVASTYQVAMAKKELNLKSYFSKKVSEPSVASSSHDCETPAVTSPVQDRVEKEQESVDDLDSSDTATSCSCQCCTVPETPYQPSDVSDSKVRHAHHSKDKSMGQKVL